MIFSMKQCISSCLCLWLFIWNLKSSFLTYRIAMIVLRFKLHSVYICFSQWVLAVVVINIHLSFHYKREYLHYCSRCFLGDTKSSRLVTVFQCSHHLAQQITVKNLQLIWIYYWYTPVLDCVENVMETYWLRIGVIGVMKKALEVKEMWINRNRKVE